MIKLKPTVLEGIANLPYGRIDPTVHIELEIDAATLALEVRKRRWSNKNTRREVSCHGSPIYAYLLCAWAIAFLNENSIPVLLIF